jgi:hypothetical protein
MSNTGGWLQGIHFILCRCFDISLSWSAAKIVAVDLGGNSLMSCVSKSNNQSANICCLIHSVFLYYYFPYSISYEKYWRPREDNLQGTMPGW